MSPPEYSCAQAWAALSAAHARIDRQLADALAHRCGLSINEFEILLRLHRAASGRLRLGELNESVPLTQPALSRAVTRLAGRGLVTRSGAPGDGRGVLIILGPAQARTRWTALSPCTRRSSAQRCSTGCRRPSRTCWPKC